MRIIFCGTPDYAVPSLRRLAALAPRHQVVGVVSQPDRPKGRSRMPTPPPVVLAARELGIPLESILQPKSINRPEILTTLRALSPDLLCVVAYGNLLKTEALALPKLFPINAHGSLLPRHRGASPIQGALLAGDTETGVTIMRMELTLDSGPMLLSHSVPIRPTDDAGTLHDTLSALSADCFVEAVEQIAAGNHQFTPQDESRVTYVTKLDKTSGQIDWNKDAAYLDRFIRAMNPWPGAWTRVTALDGSQALRVRVARATPESSSSGAAGESRLEGVGDAASFLVACAAGSLRIQSVQPEGKREMSVAEFVRGSGKKFAPTARWM
jgi:methionyl-tRNA formyltransferase